MKQIQRRKAKGQAAKSVLRLPDLEVAKSAVLSRSIVPRCATGYRHAFDEFVDWYCSEPRLSFNKTVGHSLPDAPEAATSRPWDDQDQIQFLLGHESVLTTEKYLGCTQRFAGAANDRIGIEPTS